MCLLWKMIYHPENSYYRIGCINYSVHREIILKTPNRTFNKRRRFSLKKCGARFFDWFLYSEKWYITRELLLEDWKYRLFFACSVVGVYVSLQIQSTYKNISLLNNKKEHHPPPPPWFLIGTAVSAITVHMPCVFYTPGTHVCLWVDRRSHFWWNVKRL